MTSLKTMLKWEFLLQLRNMVVPVSFVTIILYIAVLYFIPAIKSDFFYTVFLFFDPALLGITFVGILVLFEKTENTLNALNVTPMEMRDYILTKITSLTILAVLASVLFVVLLYFLLEVTFNNFALSFFFLLVGITLTSVFMTLVGFIIVSRYTDLNDYLMGMAGVILLLMIPPMLQLSGFFDSMLFYIVPTQASFVLLLGVFQEVETWEIIYAVAYLAFWIALCYFLAKKAFYKNIILGGK